MKEGGTEYECATLLRISQERRLLKELSRPAAAYVIKKIILATKTSAAAALRRVSDGMRHHPYERPAFMRHNQRPLSSYLSAYREGRGGNIPGKREKRRMMKLSDKSSKHVLLARIFSQEHPFHSLRETSAKPLT